MTNFGNVEAELSKFISIANSEPELFMEMFSPFVDEFWHRIIIENRFSDFCKQHSLMFVTHKENKGEGVIPWVEKYQEKYGTLPDLWFANKDGKVDLVASETYNRTGVVRACWDCHPYAEDNKRKLDLPPEPTPRKDKEEEPKQDSGSTG